MSIATEREESMNKSKDSVVSGLIWSFAERISAQLVTTIVSIVLARLLDPTHYGVISIVTVFISLCNVFVASGMGSALVQRNSIDDVDYNTAFSLNMLLSIGLYALLYFLAPLISAIYGMPILCNVIRVMGIRLPFAAINSIQEARVQREMAFQKFFITTLSGTIFSAIVGIILAYKGAGVWALVAQYLTNAIVNTFALSFVNKWMPKFQLSRDRAKSIFTFGSKVLSSQFISTLTVDIRSLIIGKVFGSSELAYFDQGKKYPALVVNNVNAALNKVMLPVYSKQQDNIMQLKSMLRHSINVGIYILAPILIGFAAVSDTFVSLILTEKWLPCVPFLQIFCFSYLTRPLESSCHQALLALGKAELVLKILMIVDAANIIFILVTVFIYHDLLLTAIGALLATLVSIICFMVAAKIEIAYQYKEQLSDIIPTLIMSVMMYLGVRYLGQFINSDILRLLAQIAVGIIIYLIGSVILKLPGFNYMLKLIRKR